ncbi:HD domain-containing protein [Actinospica sp. MGRD01-02]|uniref:HD domain-containing protein n=1 Tax=Actinospica acidithermotolerans TaxID=2828514 RepID=A0A941EGM0_9ACTN|nr:HD domain-containing protein [Actinospica acidithermotolerans]MBR7830260.1 HD domain-containing protein [Actinospica acidithermotolerans]
MDLLPWAQSLAEQLLAQELPRRWAHTQGVGYLAEVLAGIPALGDDAELLAAAVWLHDIGYAPGLADTGMHQLDGARHLRDTEKANPRLCALIAHHTYADIEARHRDLHAVLEAEFPPIPGLLADALTYCDVSTTPDGELTNAKDRLTEIFARYAPGSIVYETMTEATPLIFESVARISALMSTCL